MVWLDTQGTVAVQAPRMREAMGASLVGVTEILTGDAAFDERFVLVTNQPEAIRARILGDAGFRQGLVALVRRREPEGALGLAGAAEGVSEGRRRGGLGGVAHGARSIRDRGPRAKV